MAVPSSCSLRRSGICVCGERVRRDFPVVVTFRFDGRCGAGYTHTCVGGAG